MLKSNLFTIIIIINLFKPLKQRFAGIIMPVRVNIIHALQSQIQHRNIYNFELISYFIDL